MAADPDDRTLTYERPAASFATRRQFRILLVLLLLNFAITLQTAYAPGLRNDLRSWWDGYQSKRQSRALHKQAMNFVESSSKVVWDENPQSATGLLAGQGYGPIRVERSHSFLAHRPFGARAVIPTLADNWNHQNFRFPFPNHPGEVVVEPDECALILLHGFKTSGGADRLVYVYVKGHVLANNPEFPDRRAMPPLDKQWSSMAEKELGVVAGSCTADADGRASLAEGDSTFLTIYPPGERQPVAFTWSPPANRNPEQIRLDSSDNFRFYAGKPDPANPSQFTFDYDFGQQHGTVHGWLAADGTVQLKPDTGAMLGSRWYPTGIPPAGPR